MKIICRFFGHKWRGEKEFVSCKRCDTTMAKRDLERPTRYPAQKGTWTLVAPYGRTWEANSPLAACGKEQRERIPPSVALERIFRELRDETAPRAHIESDDCWCSPTLDYTCPETGVKHWIHHEPN